MEEVYGQTQGTNFKKPVMYNERMVIMGIDPGTATTGWGAVDKKGDRLAVLDFGTIDTPAGVKDERRLLMIYDDLTTLISKFRPQAVALEELFFGTNAKTALTVGQARGVVLLAAVTAGLAVYSYTPLEVKMAIAGYGRADKKQIQEMVKTLLKLSKVPKPDDAADALAVALTHCFSFRG